MKKFREFMVLVMIGLVSAGAFGQGKGGDKRPPKEPERVRSPKPQPTPPPQNTNRPKPPDNRKRP